MTLLSVLYIYIYILDYRNDIKQKENSSIFFLKLEFKIGQKAGRQLTTLTHLAQELLTTTVKWWFKKFYKGEESLKMRSIVGSHQKLTMTIESHHQIHPLQLYKSCQRTQHRPLYCRCFKWCNRYLMFWSVFPCS